MNRVIVLEGPDGAGKTTLANKLQERGYRYVHNGLYPDDTPEQLLWRYTDQLSDAIRLDLPTVIDRSYLSELIYGKVMRDESRFDETTMRMFRRLTLAQDVREIICLPDWETVQANWFEKRKERFDPINRKGDYVDAVAKLRLIYTYYQRALLAHEHYLSYNYTFDSISILSELSPLWRKRHDSLYWGTIGSPRAIYLIVGEQVNTNKAKYDLPFWDLGASSKFLNEAIFQATVYGVYEADLAYTNAYDHAGRPQQLKSIIKHCLPRFWRAIALGNKAAEACEREGIPYKQIPHPSYWKRFKQKEAYMYTQKLQGALCA